MSRLPATAEASAAQTEPQALGSEAGLHVWLGLLAVFAISTIVFFFHLGAYGLWEPDEARYAEIAREMIVLRDYIVPHLNYVPYIEKPPLLYWLTAASMHLFGIDEFAARFVNASAAMLGVLATWLFAYRAMGARQALWASAMLATSALYAVMAQVLTTDMLLTAWVTIALFAFYLHWREGGRWCWLMYVAAGLAVLTKGPIGVVIPAIAGLAFLAIERDLRKLFRRFHLVAGAAIVIAIAAPWFIAISIRQPDFIDFYFVGEHFRRFFEASYSHGEPIYYYAPWILAGALPWTIVAAALPWRALDHNPARRFCLIAAVSIFTIFSLASAKLIPYILPAMPPLMVVIGSATSDVLAAKSGARIWRRVGLILLLAGVGIAVVALAANRFASPYPAMIHSELIISSLIVVATGLVLQFAPSEISLVSLTIGSAALLLVASYGRIRLGPTRSYAALGRALAERAPDARLVCFPRNIESLPFYTGKRVILVGAKTELDYGAHHAADADHFFFTRRADLMRLWQAPAKTVLIVDRSAFTRLSSALGRYWLIAQDRKKIAVGNWPPEEPASNRD